MTFISIPSLNFGENTEHILARVSAEKCLGKEGGQRKKLRLRNSTFKPSSTLSVSSIKIQGEHAPLPPSVDAHV